MTKLIVKRPSDCSIGEIVEFENLVKSGGEVIHSHLRDRIMRAEYLIFLQGHDRKILGVAALKHSEAQYREKVFRKAGSVQDPDKFELEIGWIYVIEECRGQGFSLPLLEKAIKLSQSRAFFATTREENVQMNRTNVRCGLERSGNAFKSDNGDYNLLLYIKNLANHIK